MLGEPDLPQKVFDAMMHHCMDLEFDELAKMLKALEYIMACDSRLPEGRVGGHYFSAASSLGRIRLFRVKDRMCEPSAGGWADALINFTIEGDGGEHICEMQLAHEQLMT